MSVNYPGTNENPFLIMELLKPEPSDVIYSVGASGTVNFGFLSKGAKIISYEIDSAQCIYHRQRIDGLRSKDDEKFRSMFFFDAEDKYNNRFMKSLNSKVVRKHIDNLELVEGDILKPRHDLSSVTKLYFSNVLDDMHFENTSENKELLYSLINSLPTNTLLLSTARFASDTTLDCIDCLVQEKHVKACSNKTNNWNMFLYRKN